MTRIPRPALSLAALQINLLCALSKQFNSGKTMRKKAKNAFSKINQKTNALPPALPHLPLLPPHPPVCLPTLPDPASSSHLKAICVQKQSANRQTNRKQIHIYTYIYIHGIWQSGWGCASGRLSALCLFRWLCPLGRERSERILCIEWAKQRN